MSDQHFHFGSSASHNYLQSSDSSNVTPNSEFNGLDLQNGGRDSNQMTLLPEDYVLDAADVLCGRGTKCFNHEGNRRFRQLVQNSLRFYVDASNKTEKTLIIRNIVDQVRIEAATQQGIGKGGRGVGFVKYDPLTDRYYEVGDLLAREKTSQAFRDALHGASQSCTTLKSVERKKSSKYGKGCTFAISSPAVQKSAPAMTTFYSKPEAEGPTARTTRHIAVCQKADAAMGSRIEKPTKRPFQFPPRPNEKLKIRLSVSYPAETRNDTKTSILNTNIATNAGRSLSDCEEARRQLKNKFSTVADRFAGHCWSNELPGQITCNNMPIVTATAASYIENVLVQQNEELLPPGKITYYSEHITGGLSSSTISSLTACPTVDAALSKSVKRPNLPFQFHSKPNKSLVSVSERKGTKNDTNTNILNYDIETNADKSFSNVDGRQLKHQSKLSIIDDLIPGCNSSDEFLGQTLDGNMPDILTTTTECIMKPASYQKNSFAKQNYSVHNSFRQMHYSLEQKCLQQKQQEEQQRYYPGQEVIVKDKNKPASYQKNSLVEQNDLEHHSYRQMIIPLEQHRLQQKQPEEQQRCCPDQEEFAKNEHIMPLFSNDEIEAHSFNPNNSQETGAGPGSSNPANSLLQHLIFFSEQKLEQSSSNHLQAASDDHHKHNSIDDPFEPRPI